MQGDTAQGSMDRREGHERQVKRILDYLPHAPALALSKLPSIACPDTRRTLASLIAQIWARQDINAAWNAVSRSPLNATEKQLMFNELWG
jgi:hypothetical protein